MSLVVINAGASTAGGGITYLRNVLPRLGKFSQHLWLTFVHPDLVQSLNGMVSGNVEIRAVPRSRARRLFWEQIGLPRRLRKERADLLVSLGNFATAFPGVPQILFSRNDLYFSDEFRRDLMTRRLVGVLLANRLKSAAARISIRVSDYNVVPSCALRDKIVRSGIDRELSVVPFGVDAEALARAPLDEYHEATFGPACWRILLVSHYNYFRNFETLLRAMARIAGQSSKPVRLVLTTNIERGRVIGGYDCSYAAALIDDLGLRHSIDMLGAVEYSQLLALYEACDLFVFPSYSESFGHPMVEAMAAGLPVIAADLPVHREVCGDAALYFGAFDDAGLAATALRVLEDRTLAEQLSRKGRKRSEFFSWDAHVSRIVELVDVAISQTHSRRA